MSKTFLMAFVGNLGGYRKKTMWSKIKFIIHQQQFQPTLLGLFVNPFYLARKGLFQHIIAFTPQITGKTLDIGCGKKPYQTFCNSALYIGLEMNRDGKEADCYYDGQCFPFANNSFDTAITSQVLEHVFTPNDFLAEINRVLKTDGLLLLATPFVWDEHEQPFDYGRYSSFGLTYLLNRHGFEVLEYRKSVNNAGLIFQLINAYIYKKTVSSNRYLNMITTLLLMSPLNIVGEIAAKCLPNNDDLYLDNVVLVRKKQ